MTNDTKAIPHVFEGLFDLFAQVDRAFAQIGERHPREYVCRKGCSDCCHAFFDVSYVEAMAIEKAFDALPRSIKRDVMKRAQKAMKKLERLSGHEDPSRLRIRCPFLTKEATCILYRVRPINCRTYGVPTEFQGTAHVCPKSDFKPGITYTTLHLGPIHQRLLELSLVAGGPQKGSRRYSIAHIVLAGLGE